MIDETTGFEVGVAQRPGAPFPEEGPIPTQTTELEAPIGNPSAFDDDFLPRTEDATIEGAREEFEIPVTPEGAAELLGADDAQGNEYDNTSLPPDGAANSTNAETLSASKSAETGDSEGDPKPKAKRRTKAEIEADEKAAAEAAASDSESGAAKTEA